MGNQQQPVLVRTAMNLQKYVPVLTWIVGCVVVACLVQSAVPWAGAVGHIVTAVVSGFVGMIALARHIDMRTQHILGPRQQPPVQHVVHYHHQCGGMGEDDGYDGWMEQGDQPRPPYPPFSRN